MGLNKEILKHSAIYSFATVLGSLISFVMLPFYAHIFHTEGYGVIAMLDASLGLLSIIFASGLHLAIMRIYHEERETKKDAVISTAVGLVWAGGLAAILLPMAFSAQLSSILLGSEKYKAIVILALLSFWVDVGGQSASTALLIRQQSIRYSAINLVRLVVSLAMNIWLVLILEVGLIGVFITSLVTAIFGSALYLFFAIRGHGIGYDKRIASKLIKFQLPLVPGDLISFASRQAERYLIRFIIDIRAVGILEMAYKFPSLLNLFVTFPFAQAWRTKAIEIAEHDVQASRIIGRMFTNYAFVMVFAGTVLAIGIGDLLKILTPSEFWAAAGIARLEIMTTILAGSNSFLVFGLMFKKRTGEVSAVKGLMAIIKVPLAFLLIFSYQLNGAAYSALLVEGVTAVVLLNRSQKCYRVDYEYVKLLLIAIYGALTYWLVTEYGIAQVFDLSKVTHVFMEFASDVIGLAPLSDHQAEKLLRVVRTRQDSVISLVTNMFCSLAFLLALPLLFLSRERGGARVPLGSA